MKFTITKIFLLFCIYVSAQNHSIDQHLITFSDYANVNSFYQNTYYNAYDTTQVSWEIIESSMPQGWEFSNCFPNCYNPGITSGTNNFLPNTQQYLNCHFFPNNTPGTGIVKMQITTNNEYIDTVTWEGTANFISSINDEIINWIGDEEYLIYDVSGKRIKSFLKNSINIVLYKDGRIEKKVILSTKN